MNTKLPFENKFEQYNKAINPGLAAMVIKGGKVVFKNGYGYSNLENQEKIVSSTNFRMASVAKQYTAMAIAILEEKEKISSDHLITRYFTDFPECMNEITIYHLLHHQSGLPDYHCDFCSTSSDQKLVTNYDIYCFYKNCKQLDFKAGNKYEYSNGGYNLLATLVENVSGLSFQKFVKDNIFKPAGMVNSEVIDYQKVKIQNKAKSYSEWPLFENIDYNSCNPLYGEGGIFTSLDDTEGWISALGNDLLVKAETRSKLFTPAVLNNGEKTNYGYGWFIGDYYKNKIIYHGGSWLGFNTMVANFPEHDLWIVAYANSHAILAGNAMEEMAKYYL